MVTARNTQATSFAHALFLCQNTNEQALMRIHVHFERPEERARQGSKEVTWLNKSELHANALELSTAHCCEYLPTLLGFRKRSQETTTSYRLLPGGYISYLVMTNMPGIRLGANVKEEDSLFWSLRLAPSRYRAECDEIRGAFKVAYRDLLTIGIVPEFPGLKNHLWEKQSKKISRTKYQLAYHNNIWTTWGLTNLSKNSRWYEAQYGDTDMFRWKL
ncbi:hypothetical protein V8E54_000539 [Elaphomyces granulatus]